MAQVSPEIRFRIDRNERDQCEQVAERLGMDANDMKLLSAVIVAVALCVPVVWERYKLRSSYTKGDEANA